MEDALFIAIPSRFGIRPETTAVLVDLTSKIKEGMPNSCLSVLPGSSDIRMARSDLAYAFLETQCTKMLFIDDDLVFSPLTVSHLFNAHGDIVCATYRKRLPPHHYAFLLHEGQDHPRKARRRMAEGQLFLDVAAVGCGLMMIDRKVVEGLYKAHDGGILDYYMDVEDKRRCLIFQAENWVFGGKRRAMGEDFSFCLRAAQAGFKTECIVDAPTDHAGVAGNIVEFFPELIPSGNTNSGLPKLKEVA